ncbi:MAG: insulinase family protein [Myxococcales bacterium]|nr:insulinase family protein [Myxococcales bacterium]
MSRTGMQAVVLGLGLGLGLGLLPVTSARAGEAGPAPRPKLGPPPAWLAPVPKLTTTPSGMKVAVLERHELPLVHLLVTIHAGASLDPPGKPGLAAMVSTMLQEGGAGTLSAPALAAAFEALGDELQVECDRDGVRLQMTVMTRHLERALALLGDVLARPRFEESEWVRARAKRIAELVHRRDEPRFIADAVFDRVVFGDHVYGSPLIGTPESIEKLTVADLRAFYQGHYGPRTTAVLLVGDVAPDRAAKLVGGALDGWTSTAAPAASPSVAKQPPARFVLVDRPGAPQSEVRVGHVGLARSSADFAASRILNTVLGESFTSRLVQNLREKRGYTYGIAARFGLFDAPGPFAVRTAIRTDVTAPALQEIVAELRAIRLPLSAEEVGKGRALVLSALVENFGDGRGAAQGMGDLLIHGLPLDAWAKLPAALEGLKAPALVEAAARLYRPDGLTVVVVGDRKTIEPALRGLPFGKTIELRNRDGELLAP